MSQGVNKVLLIGNLGQDPEVRYTQNGTAVANLSVATNRQYKDRNGEKQTETEWHRVTAWARLAEICGEYLRKGSQVYIEGRIQTDKWQDRDGNDRYTTKVIASEMQMLGGGGGQGSGGGGAGQGSGGGGGAPSGGGGGSQPDFDQDFDDDIPFGTASVGPDMTGRVS